MRAFLLMLLVHALFIGALAVEMNWTGARHVIQVYVVEPGPRGRTQPVSKPR